MQLILASGSIGRKELLQYIGIPFDVVKSSIDEYAIVGNTPHETLKIRARAKGVAVVNTIIKYPNKQINKYSNDYMVLAADTSVVFEGKLYGKPKDRKDAEEMFSLFSGKVHEVVTATYVGEVSGGTPTMLLEESTTSLVTFKQLSQMDINRYLNVTDYTRFAG